MRDDNTTQPCVQCGYLIFQENEREYSERYRNYPIDWLCKLEEGNIWYPVAMKEHSGKWAKCGVNVGISCDWDPDGEGSRKISDGEAAMILFQINGRVGI